MGAMLSKFCSQLHANNVSAADTQGAAVLGHDSRAGYVGVATSWKLSEEDP